MVVAESSSVENHLIQRHMTKLILSALLICLVVSHTVATDQEDGKTAARFGVGVCLLATNSVGPPKYSILIATYEPRWNSFVRIFWD